VSPIQGREAANDMRLPVLEKTLVEILEIREILEILERLRDATSGLPAYRLLPVAR